MFRNYVKVALRSLAKQKVHAVINIFGLAIGIACCIMIYLFVRDETTYDAFHEQKDRIYCAVQTFQSSDGTATYTRSIPNPGGPALKSAYPQVQEFVRLWDYQTAVRGDGHPQIEQLTFVDPAFLRVFTFPLAAGDAGNALGDIGSLVITESAAKRYFGSDDPLGRTLSVKLGEEFQPFTVSGVARDVPANSSIHFSFLLPLERARDVMGEDFLTSRKGERSVTYVLLDDKSNAAPLAAQMNSVMGHIVDTSFFKHTIYPLTSLHLDKSCLLIVDGTSDPLYSYLLTGLGLLVLLIACVNFMNLSVASSAVRVKEIGVRQVVGARRIQLLGQFWSEGLILSLLALLIGIVLTELLLPTFNSLTGKRLTLDIYNNVGNLAALGGICLLTGLIAGSYPAILLSRLRPVGILTRRLKIGGANFITRLLIVGQFSATIFLVMGAVVMANQLDYMKNKDLGFDDEQLIFVRLRTEDNEQLLARFKNEIQQHPSVISTTATDAALGGSHMTSCTMTRDGQEERMSVFRVDADYLKTVGVRLRAGRNFSETMPTDKTQGVLVNEALVRAMNLDQPVGQSLSFCLRDEPSTILGVVEDFHYWSMRYTIGPVVFHMDDSSPIRYFNIRLGPDDLPATLAFLKEKWEDVAPGLPFEYSFVNEQFDIQYRKDERWNSIISSTGALAILISCMGLFAMSALTTGRRSKEIGIRKIHGASANTVVRLISREFVVLVLLASCIAWPVGYWIMGRWLENFVYRINIGPQAFIVSSAVALGVALISISYQIIKAANANPVDVLKYE